MSEIITVTYSDHAQANEMAQVLAKASMDHCGLEFSTDGNRLQINAASPLLAAIIGATSKVCGAFSRSNTESQGPQAAAGSAAH